MLILLYHPSQSTTRLVQSAASEMVQRRSLYPSGWAVLACTASSAFGAAGAPQPFFPEKFLRTDTAASDPFTGNRFQWVARLLSRHALARVLPLAILPPAAVYHYCKYGSQPEVGQLPCPHPVPSRCVSPSFTRPMKSMGKAPMHAEPGSEGGASTRPLQGLVGSGSARPRMP